ATLFDAALGTGVGMGLTSILFLLLDVSGVASPAVILGADVVLVGVLAWQWQRTRASGIESTSDRTTSGFRWTWLLALAFGVALLMSGIRLVQMAAALPVGEWDAWALWNLRAKFLAGPSGAWRYALSPLLKNSHPDYPLLLPAFVARVWKAGGTMDAIVPIITALLFFAALIALLVSVIALLRGVASALLAGLVILSTTSLLTWAPSQYADIPLAFYYLAAIALLFLEASQTEGVSHREGASQAEGERWTLLWAGLCTGSAAWTKNEGIAFLASIAVVFLAFTFWQRRSTAALFRSRWLLAGAVPGILLTLWLKFFLAPAVDPLVTQGASGLARLADPSRYAQVANGFFSNLLNLGSGVSHPLILLAILAILVRWKIEERYQQPSLIATAVLLLVFLSYCLVYLITPYGLAWQVQSSFDRLLLQIWPSVLLVFFIQLRSVADPVAATVPAKGATRKSPVRSNKPVTVGNAVGNNAVGNKVIGNKVK
ncbi:MAG: hypothetical protein ABSE57_20675, partial [Bryobacteraceae bacterium]